MKSFFNYSKNRLLYSVLKFFVFLLIAYLLANFINIQTVMADSEPLLCESKDGVYDFSRAYLTINSSSGKGPEKILYDTYLDAYSRMFSSVGWSKYFVSLSVASAKDLFSDNFDDKQAQSFTFEFYSITNGPNWGHENFGYRVTLWYKHYYKVTYVYKDGDYVYSNYSSYTGSGNYNTDTLLITNNSSCNVYPLRLFTGTINFNLSSFDSMKELYYPLYMFDYPYMQIIGQDIPYITDYWIPEITSINYKEISLDSADYLVLWPKNNIVKDYTMFYKGMVCPTAVYNYGTLANTDNTNRCTIDYSDFTRSTFSVIQSDIDNNAIYYFKGYKKGASIKINVSDWNYKLIYYDKDHTLTIGDNTYELLNYTEKDLPNNAVINEKNNFAPGDSDNFFDTVLDGLKAIFRSIKSFFETFFDKLISGIKTLFIPSNDYMNNFVSSMQDNVLSKLGILAYPFELFISIGDKIANLSVGTGIIHIPSISDPFYHHVIIEEQDFNLLSIFTSSNFNNIYNIYLYSVDVVIIVLFLNFCKKKWNSFFDKRGDTE